MYEFVTISLRVVFVNITPLHHTQMELHSTKERPTLKSCSEWLYFESQYFDFCSFKGNSMVCFLLRTCTYAHRHNGRQPNIPLMKNVLYINKSITVKFISFHRMWPKDVSTQLSPVKPRCRFRYYFPIGHSTRDDALSPF